MSFFLCKENRRTGRKVTPNFVPIVFFLKILPSKSHFCPDCGLLHTVPQKSDVSLYINFDRVKQCVENGGMRLFIIYLKINKFKLCINISIIGAGNVAFHIARALQNAPKYWLHQIYSRRPIATDDELARFAQKGVVNDLAQLQADSDIYLIAISDDAIADVSAQLNGVLHPNAVVAHTSGSVPLNVLSAHPQRGIWYPLQTFSRHRPLNFADIPLVVHANTPKALQMLSELALALSPKLHLLNDEQRQLVHVAAVFANNFSNHLFAIADDFLQQHQLPFDLLKPLITETARKVQDIAPQKAQTGPAKRGDKQTIERHLFLLKNMPTYQNLYQILSDTIQQVPNANN